VLAPICPVESVIARKHSTQKRKRHLRQKAPFKNQLRFR
jgi:hypothetical protein